MRRLMQAVIRDGAYAARGVADSAVREFRQ